MQNFSNCIEVPLMAFGCYMLFGLIVVSLTHSIFLFSILSYVVENKLDIDLLITSSEVRSTFVNNKCCHLIDKHQVGYPCLNFNNEHLCDQVYRFLQKAWFSLPQKHSFLLNIALNHFSIDICTKWHVTCILYFYCFDIIELLKFRIIQAYMKGP